jgi:hypothetical protein
MTRLLGAEHVEELQKELKESNDKLVTSINNLIESIKNIKSSNDDFVKSQRNHQFWLCFLTLGLIIATAAQAYIIYWTSRPERGIEFYQAITDWQRVS